MAYTVAVEKKEFEISSLEPIPAPLWVRAGRPAVVLAPMEGVTDGPMRELVGRWPGFTFCVSEFLRITQEVPPKKVFSEHMPELSTGSHTQSGLPVGLQLLGGDPERLAESAALGVKLGAIAIDLNFGCPAPTVNRHDGGAAILRFPHRVRGIVEAVRKAVPAHVPVSAKLRLGWDQMTSIHENAERAAEGGADWITIHGRTKVQGYIPPAYWGPIGEVNRRLKIPVVANGEIWTREDFLRCRDETGCEHFMLGRGALADPALPAVVARELGILDSRPGLRTSIETYGAGLENWRPLLKEFIEVSQTFSDREHFVLGRVKQWARYAFLRQKVEWFEHLKRAQSLAEAQTILGA